MKLRRLVKTTGFIFVIACIYSSISMAQDTCNQKNKERNTDVKLSKVTIYRPFKGAGVGGPICVRVDCGPEYLLKVNQYCTYELPPGKHILWMNYHEIRIDPQQIKKWWVLSYPFQVDKDAKVYIETISGISKFPTRLVDEVQAKKTLERYTQGEKKVDDSHSKPTLLYAY